MDELVIDLRNVCKSYGDQVVTEVLRSVDLRVARGEFVALIGPSGSGKSTLLNILGLLDRPTSGAVAIAGVETTSLGDADLTRLRGRSIGFVFQFHHLLPGRAL
jgi:lipoprotein-releasing system ATP-binding protein